MWCRVSVILPLVLVGLMSQSDALGVSFGKSNTDPPPPPQPTPSPAKICTSQRDCAGISSVTCVRTPYESQTRCLCGDNTPPVNGHCEASTKTLYHMCANSDECNDGLICGSPNITQGVPVPLHLRPFSSNDNICLCDTENGYREKDYTCSGQRGSNMGVAPALCVTSAHPICANDRYLCSTYTPQICSFKAYTASKDQLYADIIKTSFIVMAVALSMRKMLIY